MKQVLNLRNLSSKVLEELKKLNYSYHSIRLYGATFRRIIAYADEIGTKYFSEEFGKSYLSKKYNCNIDYYQTAFPKNANVPIRCIRLLGDYQLHGVIVRCIIKKKDYVKPPQFQEALTAYEKECADNEYSSRGMITRLHRLFFFIDYLAQRNIEDIRDITPVIISDYVKTIYHHHERSIATILSTLRVFLHFLYLHHYIETDLSYSVPKCSKHYYPPVPSTWKPEDVKNMLNSIDRGNPSGKRDFAILLLVAKLGIRAGDIKSIKLSDLDWQSMKICFKQQKTGVVATFPILKDIGWALIDYLKNARPASCSSPYLFVRLKAPFEAFGKNASLYSIITKYTRIAGIRIPKGNRRGLHSLRHTLASTLLEQGTPLPVITEILGHISAKSTAVYLRTNMKGLKECTLDPELVADYE